jgi:hypothetical protein
MFAKCKRRKLRVIPYSKEKYNYQLSVGSNNMNFMLFILNLFTLMEEHTMGVPED